MGDGRAIRRGLIKRVTPMVAAEFSAGAILTYVHVLRPQWEERCDGL